MSLDETLAHLNTRDLVKMGLKPEAKEVLLQAKRAGGISPKEITGMLDNSVIKDREKMTVTVRQLKELLQTTDIKITLEVTHTHHHTHTIVAEIPKEKPTRKKPIEKEQGSMFLDDSLLKEHNLVPNAKDLLLMAEERGSITPEEVAALIPKEIAQEAEKLRPTMRWVTQLLSALQVKISIRNIHVKSPDSRSPEVSYSVRPERVIERGPGRPRQAELDVEVEIGEEPGESEMRDIEGTFEEDEALMPIFILKEVIDRPNAYYRAVKNHRFLTGEETLTLSKKWHASQDYGARNQMVVHNLRWVMKIAKRYVNRGLDFDDLVQEGNIGLMTAAERFDPERGFRFLTYATWWIRQGITRAIQNHKSLIRMPVHRQEFRTRILKAACEVGQELEREPTLEEIAARAEDTVENVRKAMHDFNIPVVSLEELAYGGGTGEREPATIGDIISDDYTGAADTMLTAKEDLERCSERIRTLLAIIKALHVPEKHKEAFKAYYGLEGNIENHTLETVGAIQNVTRERIRQKIGMVWTSIRESGLNLDDKKLMAELDRIHHLENLVAVEAILSAPDDSFVLGKDESLVLSEETSHGEVIPIIRMERLGGKAEEVPIVEEPEKTTQAKSGVPLLADRLMSVVAEVCEIEKAELFIHSAKLEDREKMAVRDLAIYLLRNDFNQSREEVMKMFGFHDGSRISVIQREVGEQLRDPDVVKIVALMRSEYSLEWYESDWEKLAQCQSVLHPKQVEEARAIVANFEQEVQALLGRLNNIDAPDRYKEIFRGRYGADIQEGPPSYEEIGNKFQVTRTRIWQILENVWGKLRASEHQSMLFGDVKYIERWRKIRPLVVLLK